MRESSTRAGLVNVGCFLLGLVGFHLLLEPFLPLAEVGEVTDKLAFFAQHREDYDAVFVGSSRVYAQINPTRFDRVVGARLGTEFRSFNFGAPSLFLPESLYVLDRIAALRSTRLKWVFVELDHPRFRVDEQAGLVRREVYWHRPVQTAVMLGEVLSSPDLKRRGKRTLLAHHLLLFGRRLLHVGRAVDALARTWTPSEAYVARFPGEPWPEAGYLPYQGSLDGTAKTSKDIAAEARIFLAQVAALQREPRVPFEDLPASAKRRPDASPTVTPLLRRVLSGEARDLRAAHVAPIFLIPPVTTTEAGFLRLARMDALPLLAFNDPMQYPALYQPSARADTMHLNARGAELFTEALAGEFVARFGVGTLPAAAPVPLAPEP